MKLQPWMFAATSLVLASASGCGSDPTGEGVGEAGADGISTLASLGTDGGEVGSQDGDGDGDGDGGPKLDLGNIDAMGGGDCEGQGGGGIPGESYSYIWISNSPDGTVSKINTETGIEEARYRAAPGVGDPSRTSVNLLGDAVVVDRSGGIAKIAVTEERCVDVNNNGVIDTSGGAGDVRAWGADECVLWHVPLNASGAFGPRPVAWEGTTENGCAAPNPRVWVGYRDAEFGRFHRLNGNTGETEDLVSVPWPGASYGPYGGATDKNGDFWVLGWSTGPLVRINGDNLGYKVYQIPSPPSGSMHTYGMALDADGDPWIVGASTVHHFDAATEQWDFIEVPGGSMRGIMVDAEGRAWAANNGTSRLVEIDTVTKTLTNADVPLPGSVTPVGISIDSDGKVWVVDQGASMAFKLDPDTYQIELTVSGLISPYTYSDMTGAGLGLVTFPPTR